jgi:hypothetical protein
MPSWRPIITAADSAASPMRSRRLGRNATATARSTPAICTIVCAVVHPRRPQMLKGEPREV